MCVDTPMEVALALFVYREKEQWQVSMGLESNLLEKNYRQAEVSIREYTKFNKFV